MLLLWQFTPPEPGNRLLEHNGSKVMTTYHVASKFIGKYTGSKGGFLVLNSDGTGTYRYDYNQLSKGCPGIDIEITWGFIVDDKGAIVRFERPYGYSYPVIYNCTGDNAFRGCTARTMVDYLLEYNDGTLTVSSSSDWRKK